MISEERRLQGIKYKKEFIKNLNTCIEWYENPPEYAKKWLEETYPNYLETNKDKYLRAKKLLVKLNDR
tara:strand:+ start:228 stop:431 length:204 start_codon:yes stop_codon:yes gene_type:complete